MLKLQIDHLSEYFIALGTYATYYLYAFFRLVGQNT